MRYDKNQISFEVRLPKNVHVDSIAVDRLVIEVPDDSIVTVREGTRKIDELPLGIARRRYM